MSVNRFLVSLILILVCFIPWVDYGDFSSRGEPREALVVQSMIQTGNYLLPKSYNDSIPSKPPLFHWLGVVISQLTGEIDEFGIRLPSKIFSLIVLIFFSYFLFKKFSAEAALIFILLLSFSFEWLRASVSARVDMVHSANLACGLLSGFLALQNNKRKYWILTVVFIALSMLSKGPVAIVIPTIIFSIWIYCSIERQLVKASVIKLIFSLAISLLLGMIWYVLAYFISPEEFLDKVWYENVARMTSTMSDSPHEHSIIYLASVFFLGALPWSLLIFFLIYKERLWKREKLKAFICASNSFENFSILSIVVIFIFYSIPSGKRGVYLLAAYPFCATTFAIVASRKNIFSKRSLIGLFTACFTFTSLAQVIAKVGFADKVSERVIADYINQRISDDIKVFSFGYEFYAASFYSEKKFLRLEDHKARFEPSQSIVILHAANVDKLLSFFGDSAISLQQLNEINIGRKTVNVVKVLN